MFCSIRTLTPVSRHIMTGQQSKIMLGRTSLGQEMKSSPKTYGSDSKTSAAPKTMPELEKKILLQLSMTLMRILVLASIPQRLPLQLLPSIPQRLPLQLLPSIPQRRLTLTRPAVLAKLM